MRTLSSRFLLLLCVVVLEFSGASLNFYYYASYSTLDAHFTKDLRLADLNVPESAIVRKDEYSERWVEKNEVEAVPNPDISESSYGNLLPWLESTQYKDEIATSVKIRDFKFGKFENDEERYGIQIYPKVLTLPDAQAYVETSGQVSVLQATNDYDVQVHWVYFENPLVHGSFDKSLPFALEQGNNVSLKLVFRPQNTQSVRSKLIISLLLLDKKNPDISLLRCFKVDIEAQPLPNVYDLKEPAKVILRRNEAYSQTVTIKNPYSTPLQVRLITPPNNPNNPVKLEFTDHNKKTSPTGQEPLPYIELKPNTTHTIAKFGFSSHKTGVYKFNFSFETCHHQVSIPFEYHVLRDGFNLHMQSIDFGVITTIEEIRHVTLYASNVGPDIIKIYDVVSIPFNSETKVEIRVYNHILRPFEKNVFIGKVVVTPELIQKPFPFRGKILFKTNDTTEAYEIPFSGAYFLNLFKVNLREANFALNPHIPDFIYTQKSVLISQSLGDPEVYELSKNITVTTDHAFPLTISSYTITNSHTKVSNFHQLRSLARKSPLNITLQHIFEVAKAPTLNSKATLNLYSFGLIFAIPIGFYDMKAVCRFNDDKAAAVVDKCEKMSERIPVLDFGYFMRYQQKQVHLSILNPNPYVLTLNKVQQRKESNIEILFEREIDQFKRPLNISSVYRKEFTSYVLKSDHEISFKLRPVVTNLGEFEGSFYIETGSFERLRFRYKFEVLHGTLEIMSPIHLFKSPLAGIKQIQFVKLRNTIAKRCDILDIVVNDPRIIPVAMKTSISPNSEEDFLQLMLDSSNSFDESHNILGYAKGLAPNGMLSLEDLSIWQTTQKIWQREESMGRNVIETSIVLQTNLISPLDVKVIARLDFPRISPTSLSFQPIPQFTESYQNLLIKNPSEEVIFVEFYLVPEEFAYESYLSELLSTKNITAVQPIRNGCQNHKVYSSINDYLNQKEGIITNIAGGIKIEEKIHIGPEGIIEDPNKNCKAIQYHAHQFNPTYIPAVKDLTLNILPKQESEIEESGLSSKIFNYLKSYSLVRKIVGLADPSSQRQTFYTSNAVGRVYFIAPLASHEFTPIHVYLEKEYDSGLLLIKNNLTGIEVVKLEAYAGKLSLKLIKVVRIIGNRRTLLADPYSKNTSALHFYISKNEIKSLKGLDHSDSHENEEELSGDIEEFERIFVLKNEGNIPLKATSLRVDGEKCKSYGIEIVNCHGFSLQPGETHELVIRAKNKFSVYMERHRISLLANNQAISLDLLIYIPSELIPQSDYLSEELLNFIVNKVSIFFVAISTLMFFYQIKLGFFKIKQRKLFNLNEFDDDNLSFIDLELFNKHETETSSDLLSSFEDKYNDLQIRTTFLPVSPIWRKLPSAAPDTKEEPERPTLPVSSTLKKEPPVISTVTPPVVITTEKVETPSEVPILQTKSSNVGLVAQDVNNTKKFAKLKYQTAMQKKEQKKKLATVKIIEQNVKPKVPKVTTTTTATTSSVVKESPIQESPVQESVAQASVKKSEDVPQQEESSTLYSSLDKETGKVIPDDFERSSISSEGDLLKEGAEEIVSDIDDEVIDKVGMIGRERERRESRDNTPQATTEEWSAFPSFHKPEKILTRSTSNSFQLFPEKPSTDNTPQLKSSYSQTLVQRRADWSPQVEDEKEGTSMFRSLSNPGSSLPFDYVAPIGPTRSRFNNFSNDAYSSELVQPISAFNPMEQPKVISFLSKLHWTMPEAGQNENDEEENSR